MFVKKNKMNYKKEEKGDGMNWKKKQEQSIKQVQRKKM